VWICFVGHWESRPLFDQEEGKRANRCRLCRVVVVGIGGRYGWRVGGGGEIHLYDIQRKGGK